MKPLDQGGGTSRFFVPIYWPKMVPCFTFISQEIYFLVIDLEWLLKVSWP